LLEAVHGERSSYQSYIWVTKNKRCWEARGLSREDQRLVSTNSYENPPRDFAKYLNNWNPIHSVLKGYSVNR
jgi:hypothetical protein